MGSYSTNKEHLCSHHQHYLQRSPEYYLKKAQSKSEEFYRLLELLFGQNRYPEQLYRTCDGLLRLQSRSDQDKFRKACLIAIEYGNYTYRFMRNLLENNMVNVQATPPPPALPEHSNIRGKDYYSQFLSTPN